jgi:hypothetical protein
MHEQHMGHRQVSRVVRVQCKRFAGWDVAECLKLIVLQETQRATDQVVTPCDGTANSSIWCCGGSDSCCAPDSTVPRYTIARVFAASVSATSSPVASSSSWTSIASGTTATLSTSNSATASANDNPSSDGGLSTGAKAGVGIGAAVGALALIGLGMFITKALQWRKKLREDEGTAQSYTPVSHGAPNLYQAEGTPVLELGHSTTGKPAEIYGREAMVQELPASHEK